jgi:hypothetical protein
MANERNIRVDRQSEARPSDSWTPQSSLPVPEPKDGWVFRWIRTSSLGRSDNTNVSRQFREGWEPVKAEDHPELKIMSDINSQFKGNVEVGGLLLCKAPEEKMKARQRHFQEVSDRQIDGVDRSYLRENDPRMPLLNPERSTRTTFGRG